MSNTGDIHIFESIKMRYGYKVELYLLYFKLFKKN